MRTFSEKLNNWKSLWDQQLLCEAEIEDWIQIKESEANSLFAGRGLDTLDLGTSALKKLHSELIAKRGVIDEMAAWRQDLLHLPQQENDPINELNCKVDALVHRIGKRIKMHTSFVSQAQEVSQVKAEVQSDLERMVQRLSRVRPRLSHSCACVLFHSSVVFLSLLLVEIGSSQVLKATALMTLLFALENWPSSAIGPIVCM